MGMATVKEKLIPVPARKWRETNRALQKLKDELATMKSNVRRRANKTAVVTFKADSMIKARAQQIAEASGLSLSDVLNVSLRRYIDQESIEAFPIYEMSPWLEAQIEEAEKDLRSGKNMGPILSTPQEIENYFEKLIKKPAHARRTSPKVSQSVR